MMNELKSSVREWAYRLGLMSLIHRIRNRQTLTVFMFHRVLPVDSAEYATAEREFTFSVTGFGRCLDFIKKHYHVVPHGAIHDYVFSGKPLPHCAGLITFDDGWRDTLIHALPELRKRHLPAVLFLATEVIDLAESRWWQDMLVEALSTPDNLDVLENSLGLTVGPGMERAERTRRLTCAFAEMADGRRHAILSAYASSSMVSRQMLAADEIASLKPDVAIAGHGHTHAPMNHHSTPGDELVLAHSRLQALGGDDWAMSFPHGAYDDNTLMQAHDAGFKLCYTSDPALVDASSGAHTKASWGRIHIPENGWTCDQHGISESKLSTFLFLRPAA